MKYRKKPVVIEAYKYDGNGFDAMSWASSLCYENVNPLVITLGEGLSIETLEGRMHVSEGDWIIQGVNGEFYPCKADIFEKTYEGVLEQEEVEECKT